MNGSNGIPTVSFFLYTHMLMYSTLNMCVYGTSNYNNVTSMPGYSASTRLVTDSYAAKEGIINDELRQIFEITGFVALSGIISLAGVIANIVNIIVFLKQGLSDSITISLLGLAISDLGAVITLVWLSICINPSFAESDIPFNSPKVQYITAGWPHVAFSRITGFITAYITLERCLCIVIPLKVKDIFNPRRTVFVVVTIFTIFIVSILPVYYGIRLDWVFNEERNRTLIDLAYIENGEFYENISFVFNVFSQISSVVMVAICSLVLVNALKRNSKWRQKVSAGGGDSTSARDKKVVQMVLFLAAIFIACFMSSAVNLILMIASSEYSIVGRYKNLFQTAWSFLKVLEATNSSINIVVYYNMSTNYRVVFRRFFCPRRIYSKDAGTD